MPNTAATTITRVQKQSFTFQMFDRDHLVIDPSVPAVLSSSQPAIATVAIDAADSRTAWIVGQAPGDAVITVQESPVSANPLQITVHVTDTPNQSEVVLVAFAEPVSKL